MFWARTFWYPGFPFSFASSIHQFYVGYSSRTLHHCMGTISGPSRLDLYRSTLKKRAVVLDATQIYLRRSSCGTPSPRGAVTAPLLALQSRPSSGTVARHLSILGISSTVAASFHPPSETMFDGQSGFLSTFCMRRTFPGIGSWTHT